MINPLTQKAFVAAKMPTLRKEGYPTKQAAAIAFSMARKKGLKKNPGKKNPLIPKGLPMRLIKTTGGSAIALGVNAGMGYLLYSPNYGPGVDVSSGGFSASSQPRTVSLTPMIYPSLITLLGATGIGQKYGGGGLLAGIAGGAFYPLWQNIAHWFLIKADTPRLEAAQKTINIWFPSKEAYDRSAAAMSSDNPAVSFKKKKLVRALFDPHSLVTNHSS